MLRAALSVVLGVTLTAPPALADQGYRTVQSIAVAGGSLQILEDARLSPGLAQKLWRTAVDPDIALGEDDPRAKRFESQPLLPAKLRQIDDGNVVVDLVPDDMAPLARIEARRLGPASRRVYLVTTDNEAGWGSYSGRFTALYEIRNGRLGPVMARGADGKTEPIVLMATLKSMWKITDRSASHTVIEQVLCRPDFDQEEPNSDLFVWYVTVWSDGHTWHVAERSTPGFWEADEGWPAASAFPSAGPASRLEE